jgi:lipopolysaccharide/colanic/teichoic acid biosynthesis glycosyltransferase
LPQRRILKKFFGNLKMLIVGKVSFVGPKNENSEIYLGKKGLTGYWYAYNTFLDPIEENKFDLFYAKNQNIFLDVNILFKTFKRALYLNKE